MALIVANGICVEKAEVEGNETNTKADDGPKHVPHGSMLLADGLNVRRNQARQCSVSSHMRRPAVWVLFLLTACAPAGSHHEAMVVSPTTSPPATAASPATSPVTSPTPPQSAPTTQPTVSASLLFAALEAGADGSGRPDTVLIVGLDGKPRVRTSFTPVTVPSMGCYGSASPPAAYVAAHTVYFADGFGVVRGLSAQGQIQTVATFPTSSQQMLSFAVDPDGSRLMATVLTAPRMLYTQATCPRTGPYYAGDFTLDVFSAHAGGSPQLLYHETVPLSQPSQQYPCTLNFVGWDRVGPIGVSPACLGPVGGPGHYFGGPVVRIDAVTGHVVNPISSAIRLPRTLTSSSVAPTEVRSGVSRPGPATVTPSRSSHPTSSTCSLVVQSYWVATAVRLTLRPAAAISAG